MVHTHATILLHALSHFYELLRLLNTRTKYIGMEVSPG